MTGAGQEGVLGLGSADGLIASRDEVSGAGIEKLPGPAKRAGQPAELVTRPGDRDQRSPWPSRSAFAAAASTRREMPEVNSAIPTRTAIRPSTRPPMSSAAISFSSYVGEPVTDLPRALQPRAKPDRPPIAGVRAAARGGRVPRQQVVDISSCVYPNSGLKLDVTTVLRR